MQNTQFRAACILLSYFMRVCFFFVCIKCQSIPHFLTTDTVCAIIISVKQFLMKGSVPMYISASAIINVLRLTVLGVCHRAFSLCIA